MVKSEQRTSKVRRVFLLSIAIGAVAGFAFGLVGEPALDEFDFLGGGEVSGSELRGLLYLVFCLPALGLLPWSVHDIPVLRGVLSGIFWALMGFVVWRLYHLWKARRQRVRD